MDTEHMFSDEMRLQTVSQRTWPYLEFHSMLQSRVDITINVYYRWSQQLKIGVWALHCMVIIEFLPAPANHTFLPLTILPAAHPRELA